MKVLKIYSTLLCIILATQANYASEEQRNIKNLAAQSLVMQEQKDQVKPPTPQKPENILRYDAWNENVCIPSKECKENVCISSKQCKYAEAYQTSPIRNFLLIQGKSKEAPAPSGISGYISSWIPDIPYISAGFRKVRDAAKAISNASIDAAQFAFTKLGISTSLKTIPTTIYKLKTRNHDLKEIVSLNDIIHYEFNNDESLLLVALTKPVPTLGRSKLHKRETEINNGQIFYYKLIDTKTNDIIKEFENVKTISFAPDNSKLYITYDDNYIEQISLAPHTSILAGIATWLKSFRKENPKTTFYKKPSSEELKKDSSDFMTLTSLPVRIQYDFYHKNLELIKPNKTNLKINNQVNSYQLSPNKKYLIVSVPRPVEAKNFIATGTGLLTATQEDVLKTINPSIIQLINTTSGKITNLPESPDSLAIVTYEFSPDETKLLILQPILANSRKTTQYYLFNTALGEQIPNNDYLPNHTIAFKSDEEVYDIDNDNPANPKTTPIKITTTLVEDAKEIVETVTKKFEEAKETAKEKFNAFKNFINSEPEKIETTTPTETKPETTRVIKPTEIPITTTTSTTPVKPTQTTPIIKPEIKPTQPAKIPTTSQQPVTIEKKEEKKPELSWWEKQILNAEQKHAEWEKLKIKTSKEENSETASTPIVEPTETELKIPQEQIKTEPKEKKWYEF